MLTSVNCPITIVYNNPVQNVMQNEQSNGLILNWLELNLDFVSTLTISDLIDSTKPERSIIKTFTRQIITSFRSIIKLFDFI